MLIYYVDEGVGKEVLLNRIRIFIYLTFLEGNLIVIIKVILFLGKVFLYMFRVVYIEYLL